MFLGARSNIKPKAIPEFKLEKLKHPLYQTMYVSQKTDEFYGDFETSLSQAQELESFMQFARYTNLDKKTGRQILVNGTVVDETVRSYDPSMDPLGPSNWMSFQCYTNVTYKYKSPLIATVKHGTQLEHDLLTQVRSIMENMKAISSFLKEIEKFFEQAGSLLGKDAPTEEVGGGDTANPAAFGGDTSNVFTVPEDLINTGGGQAPDPHPVIIENMGDFVYREFDSQEEMFNYVQQDGYGWDEDKPAICFAFQVHENEDKNKYELELFFRDQWPKMYNTINRLDSDPAPISSFPNILAYTRQAYAGLNLFQIFAANSILQRRIGPEAEIIMMTVPFKLEEFKADSFALLVNAFMSFFYFISFLPLIFYMAFALAKENETGFQQLQFQRGLSRLVHFSSWFLHYTFLNIIFSLGYTILMKKWLYNEDQFGLIFVLTLLGIQSLFSFVWILKPFLCNVRMAIIVISFAAFLSFYISFASDQIEGTLEHSVKLRFSLSPITAIKNTIDSKALFTNLKFPMTFDNWHLMVENWSLRDGARQFIINFFLYLLLSLVQVIGFFLFKQQCGRDYRNVVFENSNKGLIEIRELQADNGGLHRPVYNLTLEKSQICCLSGPSSAEKTNFLEMVAGIKSSQGSLCIKDSDFYARSQKPNLSEYLVYRSQNIILDNNLTAIDHLNLFAHIQGNQKLVTTTFLCERLLPAKEYVKSFSESQRELLQTLIAICSNNPRICLLDEPTRGLGPVARNEIIKLIWRMKKERYFVISSSDSDLVNMIADSIAILDADGIKKVDLSQNEGETASYRIIVEVQYGQPNNYLIKCLWQDVTNLILEYHTKSLTYYILPDISKEILLQKTKFLEENQRMLGLIDFEIISLTPFEENYFKQNLQPQHDIYQYSIDESDPISVAFTKLMRNNNGSTEVSNILPNNSMTRNRQNSSERSSISKTSKVFSNQESQEKQAQNTEKNIEDASKVYYSPEVKVKQVEILDQKLEDLEESKKEECNVASSDVNCTHALSDPIDFQQSSLRVQVAELDSEDGKSQFLQSPSQTIKKPAYRRDFFYDFKQYRTKQTMSLFQCPTICRRNIKEHWHNKCRCLAMFLLPAIYLFLSWHCVRYYRQRMTDSLPLSPEILPHFQRILVNEKTQIGGKDTKKWIENLPMAAKAFQPTYIDTSEDEDFYGFENKLLDFSINTVTEQPWALGAYQFFEMDEERHKYKILSYANTTSPFSTSLFSQFVIESVLKSSLDDEDFEFKVKVSSLPPPKEIIEKGNFMNFKDHVKTYDMLVMSDVIAKITKLCWEPIGCLAATWFMLNAVTLIQVMRERNSQRKRFLESHGQSKLIYWLTRYLLDIVFYLPVSFTGIRMISIYEPQMEAASRSVFIQPFAALPFIYLCSFLFQRELTAILSLLGYQIMVQWVLPYFLIFSRMIPPMEVNGDRLFKFVKNLPMQSSISSMLFNSDILDALALFRQNNTQGAGKPIETDEMHEMNAVADVRAMTLQIIIFWSILILLIEWRLPCVCCLRFKKINDTDNRLFFEQEKDFEDAGESSEVGEILGVGKDLELRFHSRQKPRDQFAYMLENYQLKTHRRCCGLGICCRRENLISKLTDQIQAGTKFAIVADSAHFKSTIINSLTNRKSFYGAAGLIKKQVGRSTPIYTTQSYDVLLTELTIAENFAHFHSLGSVNPQLSEQMLVAFNLSSRLDALVKDLNANEKHLVMLILALAGSHQTVILDEPFTGLTHDQSIKIVKIIRQKYDCTLIITAKSKSHLEYLQPQQILTISDSNQPKDLKKRKQHGYLLAVRLKDKRSSSTAKNPNDYLNEESKRLNDFTQISAMSQMEPVIGVDNEELHKFISQNINIFEKLRGKKRSIVTQVVTKLMAMRLNVLVCQEIGEMVYEDLKQHLCSDELALKCEMILSLYELIESLCKRFGKIHLENRQDDYAVIRIFFDKESQDQDLEDTQIYQSSNQSSIIEFFNSSSVVQECTSSYQFLDSRNSFRPNSRTGSYNVKKFIYSEEADGIELMVSNKNRK